MPLVSPLMPVPQISTMAKYIASRIRGAYCPRPRITHESLIFSDVLYHGRPQTWAREHLPPCKVEKCYRVKKLPSPKSFQRPRRDRPIGVCLGSGSRCYHANPQILPYTRDIGGKSRSRRWSSLICRSKTVQKI